MLPLRRDDSTGLAPHCLTTSWGTGRMVLQIPILFHRAILGIPLAGLCCYRPGPSASASAWQRTGQSALEMWNDVRLRQRRISASAWGFGMNSMEGVGGKKCRRSMFVGCFGEVMFYGQESVKGGCQGCSFRRPMGRDFVLVYCCATTSGSLQNHLPTSPLLFHLPPPRWTGICDQHVCVCAPA